MFTYTCKDINGCNQYLKQIILHVFLRKTSHRLKGKVSSHAMKRENQHSSPVFYISKILIDIALSHVELLLETFSFLYLSPKSTPKIIVLVSFWEGGGGIFD